ncbi:hypothetical protein [Chryseolinea sp. H1M3-3]|uniref:hypothetical protein n=1 Tax=Chryseolinea sp. H1M3-3 TaxID=3034144 RepID=UPI0023EC1382|nr:hypothetical protein [Chryseolinea sp. H1M3-3]
MKKILSAIILLVAAIPTYAAGIEGTWKAKMQGPDGDMELTFVFKLTDGKLSGVVRTPNGDTEITNTNVNGKEFSFDVSFNDMTIKHHCTLQEDDTISMKATGTPMGDTALTLKRDATK